MDSKPRTYHIQDMWEAYAFQLLAANPNWVGSSRLGIQNYQLMRKYRENGKMKVEKILSYKDFRNVVVKYYEKARDAIIQGEAINLGNRLGKICARRVERNHAKKVIDYYKTKQQPKVWNEDLQRYVRKRIIYYTDDDWCRIGWHKRRAIRNETVYEFKITKNLRSGKGFNQLLDKALKARPTLKYKYIFYPLKVRA